MKIAFEQCNGGKKKYGGITDLKELKKNLQVHCIPNDLVDMSAADSRFS